MKKIKKTVYVTEETSAKIDFLAFSRNLALGAVVDEVIEKEIENDPDLKERFTLYMSMKE